MTCTLDRNGDRSLVLCAVSCDAARKDLAALRDVSLELCGVFVIDDIVFSAEDALRMLDETGCDLVMIARGALGNPWIFAECEAAWNGRPIPKRPEMDEIIETVKKHALRLLEDKEEYRAVREMRKHAAWYTKGIKGAAALRRQASEAESLDELFTILEGLKQLSPAE